MNSRLLPLFSALLAGLVAGCAHSTLGPGKGHGIATGALYRSAEARVLEADAKAHPDAADREVVDVEVVTPPVVRVTPYDAAYTHALPDVNKPESGAFPVRREMDTVYSKFVERWTVRHGADRSHYVVTYQPGPRNAAKVDVVPEP